MINEYAEAIASCATDALAKERADNAAGLVALLEQANKEKRAVEAERDKLRTIVCRLLYFEEHEGWSVDEKIAVLEDARNELKIEEYAK